MVELENLLVYFIFSNYFSNITKVQHAEPFSFPYKLFVMLFHRKYFVFCIVLLTSIVSKAEDLERYYKNIHSAENLIIHCDFADAIVLYDSAFLYKKPFVVDIYNQLLCQLYTNDYKKALLNCQMLIDNGALRVFFNQNAFSDFKRTKAFKHLMKNYEKHHKIFERRVDSSLVIFLKKMVEIDQNIHCLLPISCKDEKILYDMAKNDDSLAIILNNLMKEHSSLGEEVIGGNFENDTILKATPLYAPIALHEIQKGGKIIDSEIYKAIFSGELKPEIGLAWLSQTAESKVILAEDFIIFSDTLWKYSGKKYQSGVLGDEYTRSFLRRYYLADSNFNIDERVKYNYMQQVCKLPVKLGKFIIKPSAQVVGSFKEETKQQTLTFYHMNYNYIKIECK